MSMETFGRGNHDFHQFVTYHDFAWISRMQLCCIIILFISKMWEDFCEISWKQERGGVTIFRLPSKFFPPSFDPPIFGDFRRRPHVKSQVTSSVIEIKFTSVVPQSLPWLRACLYHISLIFHWNWKITWSTLGMVHREGGGWCWRGLVRGGGVGGGWTVAKTSDLNLTMFIMFSISSIIPKKFSLKLETLWCFKEIKTFLFRIISLIIVP